MAAKENQRWWYILGFLAFIVYIFVAARPISEETILKPRWITSLESNYPIGLGDYVTEDEELIPFQLGDRYGYLGEDGQAVINQIRRAYVSLSENYWAEYEAQPSSVQVMNPMNENVMTIEQAKGYPLFLDDRVFMVGAEQNSLTAINQRGEEFWTHDFPAPITCIDAAGGYVLAGTLDGALILLNSSGYPVFSFEPGGSRLSVILGCALSRDASRLAIISGINDQRFLFLERAGDTYRVVYHEFLTNGFRRPVHVGFVNNDSKVAFEREGGLGIYDISYRTSISLPMDGEIAFLDNSGSDRFLFVITSQGPKQKRLITIRYPGIIVSEAPFMSDNAFFTRRDNKIYLGGDLSIMSFELEKK
uniref:WD40 repeat domain-containing protein n=1 Tax=uncultured bacterium contig00014 TaxID=1181505 RepID=A0A806KMR9_9BACT|nr:hypothetical protein [uncultured bacterium contig00014]